MALNKDQYLLLSQMAYLDIEQACGYGGGTSIQEIYQYFRMNPDALQDCSGSISADQMLQILRVAADDPNLGGYKLISYVNNNPDSSNPDGSGLVAYAFESPNGQDRVFSFRGSENGFGDPDWDDNLGMVTSGDSRQTREAIEFANSIRNENDGVNYSATGHSLGGSHAMTLAGVLGFEGAVFNPRKVPPAIYKEYKNFQKTYQQSGFASYSMEGDIVSSLDRFLKDPGTDIKVSGEGFYDENGIWVPPMSKEMAADLEDLLDDFEKLIKRNPGARRLISDLYYNGIPSLDSWEDFKRVLEDFGYSAAMIAQLYVEWKMPFSLLKRALWKLAAFGDKYGLDLYEITVQPDHPSTFFIVTPHYSQAFPNAAINADNARCEFALYPARISRCAETYGGLAGDLLRFRERIAGLGNGVQITGTSTQKLAKDIGEIAASLGDLQEAIERQRAVLRDAEAQYQRADSNVAQLFEGLGF